MVPPRGHLIVPAVGLSEVTGQGRACLEPHFQIIWTTECRIDWKG